MRSLYHPARDEIQLSAVLQALGDPVRLRILQQLVQHAEVPCGSIELDLAPSTRSHHLKVMREAGVVRTRIEGTQRFSCVRTEDLDARFPGLLAAVLQASAPL